MKVASILAAAGLASAHTIFVSLEADGVNNGVSYGIRTPTYDGPQTDVTSEYLACNGDPNPVSSSDKVIKVTAGSNVTAIWRHTLTSGADDVIDASHLGPTLAYLKKVDDATTAEGSGDGWFKIQQDGLSNGVWGTTRVINNEGGQPIHIPECIEPGQYLLRAEMIALHAASSYPGAQLYMECAQIEVVGSTGAKTPQTYSIPGIYAVSIVKYLEYADLLLTPSSGKRPRHHNQHLLPYRDGLQDPRAGTVHLLVMQRHLVYRNSMTSVLQSNAYEKSFTMYIFGVRI